MGSGDGVLDRGEDEKAAVLGYPCSGVAVSQVGLNQDEDYAGRVRIGTDFTKIIRNSGLC